jgi:hypothetical protein
LAVEGTVMSGAEGKPSRSPFRGGLRMSVAINDYMSE